MVDIKQATQDDFVEFSKTFHQTEQGILEFQRAVTSDDARYLLARDEQGTLVGKLYLNFSGVAYPQIKEKVPRCPDLENLWVLPSHRGQGIGTELIHCAEKLCKERGFEKTGLGVATDNPEARKLYERLGYKDWGFGEFEISFTWRSKPDAPEEVIHEKITYLIKELPTS